MSLARKIARRLPIGLLGMVALVVAFEGFIARNDLKFSRIEAIDWRSSAETARSGLPTGGILILGDSQVKFGLSPLTIEAKVGQPVQCLAVQGGQAATSYFLLRKALEAGTIPSAIVVDFEPHLLMSPKEHNKRMWAELVDLRDTIDLAWNSGDLAAFGRITLGRALPSYLQRFEVRDNLMAAFKGETPYNPTLLEMAWRNRGMNRGALLMARNGDGPHDPARWGNPMPEPWKPDPLMELYTKKFFRLALTHKIPVFCALMPVDPALQDKFDRNGMDRDYFAWLRRMQDRYMNLYVFDWRHSGYKSPSFTDAMHLNYEGATSASLALADRINKAFRGEEVDRRWVAMPGHRLDGTEVAIEDSSRSDSIMRNSSKARR